MKAFLADNLDLMVEISEKIRKEVGVDAEAEAEAAAAAEVDLAAAESEATESVDS